MERTLSIVKPDGVRKRTSSERVISRFEKAGLKVIALKMAHLSKAEAEGFYAVHCKRPFSGALRSSWCSGPVALMALEGPDAIKKVRDMMGATDPAGRHRHHKEGLRGLDRVEHCPRLRRA